MLIRNELDVYDKLQHLGGMATDDILAPPSRLEASAPRPDWSGVGGNGGRTPSAGVYRAAMPGGKRISLLRVMLTDYCMMDCHYCPNSTWVPRRRFGFKVDELARLFDQMHTRQMVAGLFLSSGIFRDPDHTQERMLNVVETIRSRYGFKGYVHLKVMPGTSEQAFYEAAHRLGTRLSVNMEAPTAEHLSRVSSMKRFDSGILEPMQRIDTMLRQGLPDGEHSAVGQATQLVVGMGEESDWEIYRRMRSLYEDLRFKRVYYSPFRPVRYTPLEERPATPLIRTHRLYQLDWLTRIYRYSDDELQPVFDGAGFMDHRLDPKLAIAVDQYDRFPVDVNAASTAQLLRVPGIGPLSAERIVRQRKAHSITRSQELQAMGVVLNRALPFLRFPGHRPAPAKQAKLDLFGEGPATHTPPRPQSAAALHATHAASGCTGCPLNPVSCGMSSAPLATRQSPVTA